MEGLEGPLITILTAPTPLLIAAEGELVSERSGVLNLGVEGMMAVGAACGFCAAKITRLARLRIIAAIGAGALMAALFGLVTIVFVANQVASGLALTLFGLGLSALIGSAYVGIPGIGVSAVHISGVTDIPLVGRVLFGEDPVMYLAVARAIAVALFLFRTRAGLVLRAVGDNHASAHALGYSVARVRFLAL